MTFPLSLFRARRAARLATLLSSAAVLAGCASVGAGVGIGIPLAPGLAFNVGVGPGGPAFGLSTGWGPLGAGVAMTPQGHVMGSAGVGVGAGGVGVGVGQSVLLHDPNAPPRPLPAPGAEAGSPGDPVAP